LIEHDGGITSIAVPNPSNYVVSGSKDKQVIFWSFKDGSVIHKLNGHNDVVVKVAITSDSTVIFSGILTFYLY
jgi:WD40 repeat protein